MPKRIPPRGSRRELQSLAEDTANRFNISVAGLTGPQRSERLFQARRQFFAAAYATDHFSWDAIAAFCGNRCGENIMRSARALAQREAA